LGESLAAFDDLLGCRAEVLLLFLQLPLPLFVLLTYSPKVSIIKQGI